MLGNFSEEAQDILVKAKLEMSNLKHPYVGTEHLVLSILKSQSTLSDRLKDYNLTYDNFKMEVVKIIGTGSKKSELFLYTPLLKKIIENAILDSKENNDGTVTIEHLFSSLLEEGEGIAIRIFIGMNLDIESMYDEFSNTLIKKSKNKKHKKLLIEELGVDLTQKALNNELDPVIGRDEEVKRLMEVLCRRTKNNPILIGKAGVGKTAIVEELSRLIVSNNVPSLLLDKRIISLDMATAVAGTKYRGEFEDRMKKILNEIENNSDIILFIDEIHTLVGAGGAEGAIDASNILKPALARGKLRCIGATTTDEYKKFIEKDGALERRFQKIYIEEPDNKKTKEILLKLKPIYEKYHQVEIDDDIIDAIIDLSDKYVYDRNMPDKAIDILDEVSSKVSMKEDEIIEKIKNIKSQIINLNKDKNSYIIDNNIEKAYEFRKKESVLKNKLNKLELNYQKKNKKVTIEDIANVINIKTKIPVYEILQDNVKIINNIKNKLQDKVIGQNEAIEKLVNITKRIKLGYKEKGCYSILFVGSSGIGKSNNFIRIDMSEYADSASVNKIIGSSPGYVGYDDNKNILEEIRNHPSSVLLLDEIDKAHPKVINLFYQILDEGKIKDAKGNIIRFDNVIVMMTTNIGYEVNSVGFNSQNSKTLSNLNNYFNTAFINRIDDIIIFNKLSKNDLKKIIKLKLDNLKNKYQNKNINLKFTNNLIEDIIDKSNYCEFGARKVDKIIAGYIENEIIDKIINKEVDIKITNIKEKNAI